MRDDTAEKLIALAVGMSDGPSAFIEQQEAAGQREIVNSEVIPSDVHGSEDELTALGFVLGEPVDGDPMFRRATLPAGWEREGSDHSMWSYIVDQLGRRRCGVFYKAAFYDRSAHISVTSVGAYVSECLYEKTIPVLDEEWATSEAVLAALVGKRAHATEQIEFWTTHNNPRRVAEYREEIQACDALKQRIESIATAEA